MAAALAAALVAAHTGRPLHAQQPPAACGIDMRVLVLSADGGEAALPAITQALDHVGAVYSVHIATENPGALTPAFFSTACRGKYQAVISTSADLAYRSTTGWKSALTAAESAALAAYQAHFNVRHVAWYAYPTEAIGFNVPVPRDTALSPLQVRVTPQGAGVFSYLNGAAQTANSPIVIQQAYSYLATPLDATTTPLLVDAAGHALAAIKTYPDGRQHLAMTFDSNPHLMHSLVLGYGVINWATRGVFVGDRRIYMSPQVDDVFIPNNRWTVNTPCGTDPETTNVELRISGRDLLSAVQWQSARNAQPLTAALRLTLPFNGVGTTGIFPGDTLTPYARFLQGYFYWVNHTYDHEFADGLDAAASQREISLNIDVARSLRLRNVSVANLITPEISGLKNPAFMRAAVNAGVRYVVSDTSRPGHDSLVANLGVYNSVEPSVLMIPRRPNNLFYNVGAPAEWTAEYNCIYRTFWGGNKTYEQILDLESQNLLIYLLRGENKPWMFHQTNLFFYDGRRSLLTELLDRTIAKYAGYYNLPITSPTMDALGADIAARMQLREAGLSAVIRPDGTIQLASAQPAVATMTGVDSPSALTYGGQKISRVQVSATPVVVTSVLGAAGGWPMQPVPVPEPPKPVYDEIVIWAGAGSANIIGTAWRVEADAAAAGGKRLVNINAGAPKVTTPAANPASYVEIPFTADAGKAYHVWMRMRAPGNSWASDSVYMQFSDSVDAAGAPIWRTGTTSAMWFSLEEAVNAGVLAWGWQDNGFGSVGFLGADVRFASSGPKVLRLQTREDGAMIDQIVISAVKYRATPPGPAKSDTTILPALP